MTDYHTESTNTTNAMDIEVAPLPVSVTTTATTTTTAATTKPAVAQTTEQLWQELFLLLTRLAVPTLERTLHFLRQPLPPSHTDYKQTLILRFKDVVQREGIVKFVNGLKKSAVTSLAGGLGLVEANPQLVCLQLLSKGLETSLRHVRVDY